MRIQAGWGFSDFLMLSTVHVLKPVKNKFEILGNTIIRFLAKGYNTGEEKLCFSVNQAEPSLQENMAQIWLFFCTCDTTWCFHDSLTKANLTQVTFLCGATSVCLT